MMPRYLAGTILLIVLAFLTTGWGSQLQLLVISIALLIGGVMVLFQHRPRYGWGYLFALVLGPQIVLALIMILRGEFQCQPATGAGLLILALVILGYVARRFIK